MRAKHLQSIIAPSLACRKAKRQEEMSRFLFGGRGFLAGMEGGKGFFPVAKYTKSCSFDNMTQNLRRGSSHSAAVAQKPLMKIQSPV